MASKEPQPVHALEYTFQRSGPGTRTVMATAGNGTAGRKPPSRVDPRHNPHETGARGSQRAFVRETARSVLLFTNHRRSIMNWYMEVLKKYAVFSGRARRKEYWWFFLINLIIAWVFFGLAAITRGGGSNSNSSFGISSVISCLSSIYSLAVLLPGLGVSIRRMHDIGKSGWWVLIALIPLVGTIWGIILMATDSQPGDNQYGPNPKMMAPPPVSVPPAMSQP